MIGFRCRWTWLFLLAAAPCWTAFGEEVAKTAASGYAPLPQAVSSFGAAAVDGWLYVYGGHCVRTHVYSTESVTGRFIRHRLGGGGGWEDLPSGPALQGLAVVEHKGKIYRIGGMAPHNKPGEKADNRSLTTCGRYDPVTRRWEELPELPDGRSSHDAVVVGDRIYVVGGWKLRGVGTKPHWYDTALVMDLGEASPAWKTIPQPFRRRALTAAAFEGKVYALAGFTEEDETDLSVDVYDPATGKWSKSAEIPGPARNGFAAAACVAGGRLYLSTADGNVFRLSVDRSTWEKSARLEHPRIVHRVVSQGDSVLVVVGGAAKGDNIAATEAVSVAPAASSAEKGRNQ